MTPRNRLWVLAALAMTVGMAVPTRAADQVPIKGWFCAMPSGPISYVNWGRATHLGAFQGTASNVVAQPDGTLTGDYTFVARDGSSISGSWHVIPTGTPVNGYLPFVEPFTVTSGTGRFAGATGTGTANGLLERATGNVCLSSAALPSQWSRPLIPSPPDRHLNTDAAPETDPRSLTPRPYRSDSGRGVL